MTQSLPDISTRLDSIQTKEKPGYYLKGYIKEFDALRAISVFMVVIAHYLGQFPALSILSSAGVTMFFVLSGFLITQILLYEKSKFQIEGFLHSGKIFSVLKVFYIRRALRIFPIYYLVLTILILLNIGSAREFWSYHVFYLSNFLYAFKTGFDHLAHFWSLAVEEQFYLIWPLFILLIPARWVNIKFFVLLIGSSLIFKFWMMYIYGTDSLPALFLMPSCIESFAFGAIALVISKSNIKIKHIRLILISSIVFYMLSGIVSKKILSQPLLFLYSGLNRTSFSLFSAAILVLIIKGNYSKLGYLILNNPALLLIGKISYGIYILHMFMPPLLEFIQNKTHFNFSGYGKMFFFSVFCSIILAYISYYFYESPINNLKKKFVY